MKLCGIYVISVRGVGDYVGSSVDCRSRWSHHKSQLRAGKHPNFMLQRAFNRLGEGAFDFLLLFEEDRYKLLATEKKLIDSGKFNLNIAPDTTAPMLGRKHREDSKQLMSQNRRGKCLTAELARSIGLKRRGVLLSPEHKQALKDSHKTNKYSRSPRPIFVRDQITGVQVICRSGAEFAALLGRHPVYVYRALDRGRTDFGRFFAQPLDARSDVPTGTA